MQKTCDYFIGFATENNVLWDENTDVDNRECNYVGKSNTLLPRSLYILIFFISCLSSYILFSSFKHNENVHVYLRKRLRTSLMNLNILQLHISLLEKTCV